MIMIRKPLKNRFQDFSPAFGASDSEVFVCTPEGSKSKAAQRWDPRPGCAYLAMPHCPDRWFRVDGGGRLRKTIFGWDRDYRLQGDRCTWKTPTVAGLTSDTFKYLGFQSTALRLQLQCRHNCLRQELQMAVCARTVAKDGINRDYTKRAPRYPFGICVNFPHCRL